jgi:hypothetical protein
MIKRNNKVGKKEWNVVFYWEVQSIWSIRDLSDGIGKI